MLAGVIVIAALTLLVALESSISTE